MTFSVTLAASTGTADFCLCGGVSATSRSLAFLTFRLLGGLEGTGSSDDSGLGRDERRSDNSERGVSIAEQK
jgi:hypothetical protein